MMIETIKGKIWNLLQHKQVSLAMLFDSNGHILWSQGREIIGRHIQDGAGYSKTLIRRVLMKKEILEENEVPISSVQHGLPHSATTLKIKGVLIQPLSHGFFLYVDSGAKEIFSEGDREVIKTLGDLLAETIRKINRDGRSPGGISGCGKAIESIRELVLKFSLEDHPILLLGETGVGKNHIARLIHDYSGRSGQLVTIHTPSIPESLFESEIFGHKRGTFTDAKSDKVGFVQKAEKGTIFFDEISEVPLSFQAKLLRFIETRTYTVLGEPTEKRADCRIVAATNKDLLASIDSGRFREDLYYRLQVLEIEIPPLRERPEDITTLVNEKIDLLKGKKLTEGFWQTLYHHSWPGNIRELITVLTRAGILAENPIGGKDLEKIIKMDKTRASGPARHKMNELMKRIAGGENFWSAVWEPFINRDLDRETVKEFLNKVYKKNSCKFKRTISSLNLEPSDYNRFISLINQYQINPKK